MFCKGIKIWFFFLILPFWTRLEKVDVFLSANTLLVVLLCCSAIYLMFITYSQNLPRRKFRFCSVTLWCFLSLSGSFTFSFFFHFIILYKTVQNSFFYIFNKLGYFSVFLFFFMCLLQSYTPLSLNVWHHKECFKSMCTVPHKPEVSSFPIIPII